MKNAKYLTSLECCLALVLLTYLLKADLTNIQRIVITSDSDIFVYKVGVLYVDRQTCTHCHVSQALQSNNAEPFVLSVCAYLPGPWEATVVKEDITLKKNPRLAILLVLLDGVTRLGCGDLELSASEFGAVATNHITINESSTHLS